MRRGIWCLLLALSLLPVGPRPAEAQLAQAQRAAIGGGVGVAGGAAITLAVIVARARLQRAYLDSADDLIHWQTVPMIAAPAAGVVYGLAGEEALRGSIVGSVSGLVIGAAVGAGLGWLLSEQQEWPWAGGVIGGGVGLAAGGLVNGLREWSADENPDLELPEFLRMEIRVPLP